ncbi:HAMP domain-containing protein [Phragmitibacter flavus]|uniref:histidine kinase n=1 Tax=Phragmitibacter flavus TaxID=2576071 RepID=A0A5R8KFK2_9BACT|nr:ATP-binding protein [Phragmitibacter flavus]TLD70369.1 HAMP domain-containing protein [Phragmitibacter flavus]
MSRVWTWMRSLTGQWIMLMLLALLVSQMVFYFIYRAEQARAVLELRRDEVVARAVSVASLVETVQPELYPEILRATNTGVVRFWLEGDDLSEETESWQQKAREQLLKSSRPPAASELVTDSKARWQTMTVENGVVVRMLNLKEWNGFGLVIPVNERLWLHTVYAKPQSVARPPWSYYLSLGITALLLTLVSVLVARRVGRPLQKLTASAESLGRGEEVEPLPEVGADDLRRTAAAFNRMQLRLRRFVEDRTRMMAAISHDLRTPITSMRLRAEFLEDAETREKFIASLDEMKAMTESTLAFARDESATESTRMVDLNALIESLCEDLGAMGWEVSFTPGPERVPWRCRPNALRRALRNVIENAVRYGGRAMVSLEMQIDGLDIVVEDEGPGISAEDRERVFDPFVRLEESRNRHTGGVGLGLSIARSILRSHGGDVRLDEGASGLRVCLHLPGVES